MKNFYIPFLYRFHLKVLFSITLLLITGRGNAQLNRIEIAIDGGTYQILDKTKNIWNDGFLLKAQVLTSKNKGKKIMFWHGLSAFYSKQSNKTDTVFVDKTPLKYEFLIFDDREIVGLSWSAKWWSPTETLFSIYGGADIGLLSDSYFLIHRFPGVHSEGGEGSLSAYASPSAGLQYGKKEGFGFYVKACYQFSFSYNREILQALNFGAGVLCRF